jgi:hypothetical protein
LLTQLSDPAGVEALDRGGRGAEIADDRLDALVLEIPQHDHGTAARRQFPQRGEEREPQVGVGVADSGLEDLGDRKLTLPAGLRLLRLVTAAPRLTSR